MEFKQTDKQELENLKGIFEDIKADIKNYIEDKFDDIQAAIDGRIEELEDEEHGGEDYDGEEESETQEPSAEERINISLLSQSIANQLQTVDRLPFPDIDTDLPDATEEPSFVEVASAPASSLSELIKSQISEAQEVEVAPAPTDNLASQIAEQVVEQDDLSVVAPATSEGPVEIPVPADAPVRPMNEIIQELRNSVNAEVETTSTEETDRLVEEVVSSKPDIDSDLDSDLSSEIRSQLLSSEIKKQLS